jgi:LAS superfamily LD-carboxypeptidase LdcB
MPDSLNISVALLTGKFDPAEHPDFARIPDAWSGGSACGAYLHREALAAFLRMAEAAQREGIRLTILSATRNFDYQTAIWNDKWTGKRLVEGKNLAQLPDSAEKARRILRYSAMPGSSRHHWGTDFDLNAFENRYFEQGEGKKVFDWLEQHAASYGFCRPYTAKGPERPEGYEEEKWHWSYLPLAGPYLAAYLAQVRYSDLSGFEGSAAAPGLDVFGKYVAGVSAACRPQP